jgi:Fe-S-cluster containining protein
MSNEKLDQPGLADDPIYEAFDLPVNSPVAPQQLGLDDTIQFHCHKGISCFNACCMNIDFTLTPYDILRLARRLGLTTTQFISLFARPYDLDPHGMPGLKMKPVEEGTACQFVTEEGCSVYDDRPTACRYYAMGTMGMRRKDSSQLEDVYFMVKEPHCKGHDEPRTLTVRQYRQEQKVEHYDEMNREWLDVIVKKRSAGPTVGAPSERSFQLFYLASYDLDGFRKFTQTDSFKEMFDLDADTRKALDEDDEALLKFAMRFLKQVLFGERTIPLKAGAAQQRYEKRKEAITRKHQESVEKYRLRDPGEEGDA